MLLFGFVQAHDRFGDLIDEIAAIEPAPDPDRAPVDATDPEPIRRTSADRSLCADWDSVRPAMCVPPWICPIRLHRSEDPRILRWSSNTIRSLNENNVPEKRCTFNPVYDGSILSI